jgi:hypothetical protein
MKSENTQLDKGFLVLLVRRKKKGLRVLAFPTREEAVQYADEAKAKYKIVGVVPAGPIHARTKVREAALVGQA